MNISEFFESEDWTFANLKGRPSRHGIHSYPATMAVPYVSKILDFLQPKAVLDPFGGSGTVALECVNRGIEVYTNDINPLALLICKAKFQIDFSQVEDFLFSVANLHKDVFDLIEIAKILFPKTKEGQIARQVDGNLKEVFSKKGWKFPEFKNVAYWFLPHVILSLNLIRDILPDDYFLRACFSEVVRLVSNRRSGEFKLFRRPVEKLIDYCPDVFGQMIKTVKKNYDLSINNPIPPNAKLKITSCNAKSLECIPCDYFDCVITSPPYGDSKTTVSYGQFSRLSLQWLGGVDVVDVDKMLLGGGKLSHDKNLSSETINDIIVKLNDIDAKRAAEIKSFYLDMEDAFLSIVNKTKPNGYHIWIVGNRTVKGLQIPLDKFIEDLAIKSNMDVVSNVGRAIPYKAMPSVNSPSNLAGVIQKTMTHERLVVLRRKI